jgi:NADPH:quinone reductase-like Zn-dependent oxidoreductase
MFNISHSNISNTMSTTMQAYIHLNRGSPSTILSLSSIPKPIITSPTQLLIRVSHCALNPGASIIMHLLPFMFRASPAVPEMDFSGTVVDAGTSVPGERRLKPGTKVFGSIPVGLHIKCGSGALAQYVVVEHSAVVRQPQGAKSAEVAGLGIAGATALEIMKVADLKAGDSVLVNGASGGVGHLVTQMCLQRVGPSGVVVGVCSNESKAWISSMLKDDNSAKLKIVDREKLDLTPHLTATYGESRFDAIVDCAGIQNLFIACPAFLKDERPYVSVGPRASGYTYASMLSTIGFMAMNMLWPRMLAGTPRRYVQVAAVSNLEALQELADMVEEGTLSVHVGRLVAWADAVSVSVLCL